VGLKKPFAAPRVLKCHAWSEKNTVHRRSRSGLDADPERTAR
jgi:hypothetical protein